MNTKEKLAKAREIDKKVTEADRYLRGGDLLDKTFELIRSDVKATKIGDSLVATIKLNGEHRFAFLNQVTVRKQIEGWEKAGLLPLTVRLGRNPEFEQAYKLFVVDQQEAKDGRKV